MISDEIGKNRRKASAHRDDRRERRHEHEPRPVPAIRHLRGDAAPERPPEDGELVVRDAFLFREPTDRALAVFVEHRFGRLAAVERSVPAILDEEHAEPVAMKLGPHLHVVEDGLAIAVKHDDRAPVFGRRPIEANGGAELLERRVLVGDYRRAVDPRRRKDARADRGRVQRHQARHIQRQARSATIKNSPSSSRHAWLRISCGV